MITFHLFRIRLEEKADLFADTSKTKAEIIKEAVDEKPSREIRKGQVWKIGNVEPIGTEGLFFAFGKITKSTREVYDESGGNFIEEDLEECPYTYVMVDLRFQVCAIAKKTKIAQSPKPVGSNLAKLLDASDVAVSNSIKFSIAPISDPAEFLTLIKDAKIISRFEIEFSPPNPFDAEKDFHAPMEKFLQVTGGFKGATTIEGNNLDSGVLVEVVRSAAATGNEAKAWIKSSDDQKPVKKLLSGNDTTVTVATLATTEKKSKLFEAIRKAYQSIRGSG
jgi:hypothetical protein